MKIVTLYQCEMCGARHNTPTGALQCEDRGTPPVMPVGTVVVDEPYLRGMVLLQVLESVEAPGRSHALRAGYWTFRDADGNKPAQVGDTGPASRQSTSGPLIGDSARHQWQTIPVDTSTPRYRRAWEAMREAGLPMYLWVGGAAVPAPDPT